METLTVFERVLHQIGASAGTTKSNIVHMANVVSLIGENGFIKSLLEEAKNAVKSIEGSDPKSQFMRRDLHFKCAKLGYEAFGLAAKVNPSDIEAVEKEPKIDVQACFVVPGDAEAAQKESESLTAQLSEVEKKCKDDTLADAQRVDVLKKSVSELSEAELAKLCEDNLNVTLLYNYGVFSEKHGDEALGQRIYEAILKCVPQYYDCVLREAKLLMKRKQLEEAESKLKTLSSELGKQLASGVSFARRNHV